MKRHSVGFVFWVAVLFGCGGPSPETRCDAQSCQGCCTSDGVCRNGLDDAACGSAGASCANCAATATHCSAAFVCASSGTGGGGGVSPGTGGGIATGGSTGAAGGGTGTGGGLPCAPQTDQQFCASKSRGCGTLSAFDNCGASRTVNCGNCASNQVCDASGSCCAAESDAAFCQRLAKNCGTVTGVDACGMSRTADCGVCTGQKTCGATGMPNVCGQNLCGPCDEPPAGSCQAPAALAGQYVAKSYASHGTCSNPNTGACSYSSSTMACAEDCRSGECVQTECTLGGTECTSAQTGCKLTTGSQLRCLVVDTGGSEGMPCDDEVPGYRCDSFLRCVWPSFSSTSICAYLCETSADCAGVGLQNQHTCVKSGGQIYGWCR